MKLLLILKSILIGDSSLYLPFQTQERQPEVEFLDSRCLKIENDFHAGTSARKIIYVNKLSLKYDCNLSRIYAISNIDNFDDYRLQEKDFKDNKNRNLFIDKLNQQFSEDFKQFNGCKIQNNNWVSIVSGHILYVPFVTTYFNTNCNKETISYYMYCRYINNNFHYAIIHKNAMIKSFFRWTGCVIVESGAYIGFAVSLKPGVIVSNKCIIGDYTSIGSFTLIGSRTKIFPNINIGPKNIIGNDVVIFRNVCYIQNSDLSVNNCLNPYLPIAKYETTLSLGFCNVFYSKIVWEVTKKRKSFFTAFPKFNKKPNFQ